MSQILQNLIGKTRVSESYFTLVAGFIVSGGKTHFYDVDSALCIL